MTLWGVFQTVYDGKQRLLGKHSFIRLFIQCIGFVQGHYIHGNYSSQLTHCHVFIYISLIWCCIWKQLKTKQNTFTTEIHTLTFLSFEMLSNLVVLSFLLPNVPLPCPFLTFLPMVVILKIKLYALQKWLFCKATFRKLFQIVISSYKKQGGVRIASRIIHAEGWNFEDHDVGCRCVVFLFSYLFYIQWKIMVIL